MRRIAIIAVLFAALVAVAGTALAQTGGGYDLTWSTVDGGGAVVTGARAGQPDAGLHVGGGGYTLSGTAGQPDAGLHVGGGFTLAFWPALGEAAPAAAAVPSVASWGLLAMAALLLVAMTLRTVRQSNRIPSSPEGED